MEEDKLKKYTISTVFPNEEILNDALNKRDGIEEDIKILEEFKNKGYSNLYIKYGDRIKANTRVERAIENVLARLDKLEQDNFILANENLNSISKDKIKAKIEEHTRIKNDYMFNELKCHMEVEKGIIKVLEKLLGE